MATGAATAGPGDDVTVSWAPEALAVVAD